VFILCRKVQQGLPEMSWKNHLKEKLVDAARRLIDNLPTATKYTARRGRAPAGPEDSQTFPWAENRTPLTFVSALLFGAVPFLVPALFILRRVRAR
jgi:hypothetical protein